MYSVQSTNARGANESSGTINPAALNSPGSLSNQTGTITPDTSPRGTKRSRSPNIYGDVPAGEEQGDETYFKPQKRGRPAKAKPVGSRLESPRQSISTSQSIPPTPQSQIATLPQNSTNIAQPQPSPKNTPSKNSVIVKALPTVRDHTTDQLGAGGDEYIPRESDEAGDQKVNPNGQLNGGREYKCRTFLVPERGDKLFMLATECARVLGYRDSYLLFNKNRSLFKIIASQLEKEDLIRQEVLPYSYRSRQIAIVTARSMFRQFGSRVIRNGRRVRDDYWESKARKQGFTEEDLAGEKRPGATKARDAAAAAEANANAALAIAPRHDILYSNNPGNFMSNPNIQTSIVNVNESPSTLPMISLAGEHSDLRLRDYSSIQRPRQEISGPAYQDRTHPSSPSDLLSHAHITADYNKQINQQRCRGSEFLHHHWRQSHEPQSSNITQRSIPNKDGLQTTQSHHSTQDPSHNSQQSLLSRQTPQQTSSSQPYSQVTSHSQNPTAPSPLRNVNPMSIQPSQLGRPAGVIMNSSNIASAAPYGYTSQSQITTNQNQSSAQHFHHFTPSSSNMQRSPHQVSPVPRNIGNGPQLSQGLQYSNMQGLGQGFPSPSQCLYPSERGSHQQYIPSNPSAPQATGQNWAGHHASGSSNNWNWNGSAQ